MKFAPDAGLLGQPQIPKRGPSSHEGYEALEMASSNNPQEVLSTRIAGQAGWNMSKGGSLDQGQEREGSDDQENDADQPDCIPYFLPFACLALTRNTQVLQMVH